MKEYLIELLFLLNKHFIVYILFQDLINGIVMPIEGILENCPEFIEKIFTPRHLLFWFFIFLCNFLFSKSKSNELIEKIFKYNIYFIFI